MPWHERVRVREITNEEGNQLAADRPPGLGVGGDDGEEPRSCCGRPRAWTCGQIAKIAFTSEDRVREVLHNFNDDGFDSLGPEVRRRTATDVHLARAPGASRRSPCRARSTTACPSRPGA